MNDDYYIESVIRLNDTELITIILSTVRHGACIEVHGNNQTATNRVMVILEALNKKEAMLNVAV